MHTLECAKEDHRNREFIEPMKKIDVLWLVEHVAREMDVACAATCLAEERYGLKVAVRNMYLHAHDVMREFLPRIVVHPFFYFLSGALATEDFVRRWPRAIHVNLAWEEIFYKVHEKIKAPSDDFTRKRVLHHAWGDFYRLYLEKHGVPAENIFVNGNPVYQLYRSPYCRYYRSRDWLAEKYGLRKDARWVFFPENYRWAFIGDKIHLFTKLGGDHDEIIRMRDFSLESLKQVLQWCNRVAHHEGLELIFRPRPATSTELLQGFFEENVGAPAPGFHIIKGESVREWILASDRVFSSYSTSLIEAAVAQKPAYMAEPIPIPDSLRYDWFRHVQRVRTGDEFERACLELESDSEGQALKRWAEQEMLANGDPIAGLADYLNRLTQSEKGPAPVSARLGQACRNILAKGPLYNLAYGKKNYFNRTTHENDVFTEEDVREKVQAWKRVLGTVS